MKQFLVYIMIIFSILIVFLLGLDNIYSFVFQNGVARSKIQNILQEKDKHYDVAFFGSSRTENHIDCELVQKLTGKSCVNLGISGAISGDILMLVKIAQINNITYDNAFLQVDSSFNKEGMSPNFKARLVPFINNPKIKPELNGQNEYTLYKYLPFYRYLIHDRVVGFREFISSLIGKVPKQNIKYRFKPKLGQGLKIPGKIATKINTSNSEINELIDVWKKQNTNYNFFTAPYCTSLNHREVMNEFSSLFKNYKNYSKIFDDALFYFNDCGHLNIDGARAFTKILINDFKLN